MPLIDGDFLGMADELRSLAGPGDDQFGLRKSKLTVIQRTWAGGAPGAEGGSSDATVADVPQIYKFRPITTKEVMGSGGQYEMGDIKIGPITPTYTTSDGVSGGFSEAQLHPVTTTDSVETIYVVTGDHAGEYQFVALDSFKAISRWLVLRRRATTPVEP